jgi:hypothetical protein
MVIDRKAENLDAAWVYQKYPLSFHLKYASRMGVTKMLSAASKFFYHRKEREMKHKITENDWFSISHDHYGRYCVVRGHIDVHCFERNLPNYFYTMKMDTMFDVGKWIFDAMKFFCEDLPTTEIQTIIGEYGHNSKVVVLDCLAQTFNDASAFERGFGFDLLKYFGTIPAASTNMEHIWNVYLGSLWKKKSLSIDIDIKGIDYKVDVTIRSNFYVFVFNEICPDSAKDGLSLLSDVVKSATSKSNANYTYLHEWIRFFFDCPTSQRNCKQEEIVIQSCHMEHGLVIDLWAKDIVVVYGGEDLISHVHLSLPQCHRIFAEVIDTQKSTPVSLLMEGQGNDYVKYSSTFEIAKDRYMVIQLKKI